LENDYTIFFVYYSEDENEIYGFSFGNICLGLEYGGKYIWINELYVESEYRRNKIGTKIIKYIEKWCKDNNIKYIASMTGNNKISQQFFESNKYELSNIIWIDKTI
jgi:GNAT superfamily N-acetyltransferase